MYWLYNPGLVVSPWPTHSDPSIPWGGKFTRRIRDQNTDKGPVQNLIVRPRLAKSTVDAKRLTASTHRIQDVKSIVSQPGQEGWRSADNAGYIVAITADLSNPPGEQHGRVKEGVLGFFEGVTDTPHQENSGGDLEESCREGASEETWIHGLSW